MNATPRRRARSSSLSRATPCRVRPHAGRLICFVKQCTRACAHRARRPRRCRRRHRSSIGRSTRVYTIHTRVFQNVQSLQLDDAHAAPRRRVDVARSARARRLISPARASRHRARASRQGARMGHGSHLIRIQMSPHGARGPTVGRSRASSGADRKSVV